VSAKTESKSSAKVLVGPSMFKILKGCEKRDYKTVNIFRVKGYWYIDNLDYKSDSIAYMSSTTI
jgi:hypothetical protein